VSKTGDGAERIAIRLAEREGITMEQARKSVEAAGTYGAREGMSSVLADVKPQPTKGQ
jgi:hypothetical protein